MSKSIKKRNIFQLTIAIFSIVIICFISEFAYWRFDLTSEKRYTLADITKQKLKKLDDVVYLKIYLDGDLPIGLQRMQKAIKETLSEFRAYGKENIQYEFINPSESTNPKEREAVFKDLFNKGIEPTNVQISDKQGGNAQKLIFPGAIVSYKGKEIPLNLLHNNPGLSHDENINLSIQNFEFELIDAIIKLSTDKLPKLAFLLGHDELDQYETGDIDKKLSEYYDVYRVEINGDITALDPYNVVIIAGPQKKIPESDKIVIDQYIMKGGKVLWFIDPISVSIDSLSRGSTTLAFIRDLNIDDQLFRYGVRLNPALIQDMQCAFIPVNTSLSGQEPKFEPAPWVYYPLLTSSESNPITRNLNMIQTKFISPIDTVGGNKLIKKTVLLKTSSFTKVLRVPLLVNLSEISKTPTQREFNGFSIPVAILLEGTFESVFKNRPIAKYNHEKPFSFIETSPNSRMIVVSDADIIRNDVRRRPDGSGALISPLGYDRYSRQTFGNRDLVLNMVKYLDDDIGLMSLRSRDFKLRMLDKKKVRESRVTWQLVNLLLPSGLLICGGLIWLRFRKKKYTR